MAVVAKTAPPVDPIERALMWGQATPPCTRRVSGGDAAPRPVDGVNEGLDQGGVELGPGAVP